MKVDTVYIEDEYEDQRVKDIAESLGNPHVVSYTISSTSNLVGILIKLLQLMDNRDYQGSREDIIETLVKRVSDMKIGLAMIEHIMQEDEIFEKEFSCKEETIQMLQNRITGMNTTV